jgi:hypothetical protein
MPATLEGQPLRRSRKRRRIVGAPLITASLAHEYTHPINPLPATAGELRAIIGELDDAMVLEILNLSPTVLELEEAAVWSRATEQAEE